MKRTFFFLTKLFRRNIRQQRETEFLGYEAFSQSSVSMLKPPLKTAPAEFERRKAA